MYGYQYASPDVVSCFKARNSFVTKYFNVHYYQNKFDNANWSWDLWALD